MPCFLKKTKIKNLLKILDIDKTEMEKALLQSFSDEVLHNMSEEELIRTIKDIHEKRKRKLKKEIAMLYS